MNYLTAIREMRPDDSIDVNFPKGFMLTYRKGFNDELTEFECSRLSVYFWDEDDHWGKSYYYYSPNKSSWTCKEYALTKESEEKVKQYLKSIEYPYEY